ncbi:LytTR family DNA-binding domain-containing protein [Anaerocolumna aminovalerica]|uniref:LytR/AlgR family response regulator transcription factor n=1 Tax=Anaerocolumna aminovalerica TaxID=1527 RepID=UPI001C0ED8A1|nr:LytTR family DNA-binding domain-containing protein [Anaerocolumna aminovalerica]MBU5331141.1 LytTR family DNA-binding domain-containing protein [Anaerocolumna aminovalerica]
MFNIVICEEDAKTRSLISTHTNQYLLSKKVVGRIALSTDDPQKVLEYVKYNSNQVNIYLFGIFFDADVNGLTLAKEVRKNDISGYLIYITAYPEFSLKTFQYKLRVFNYIIKDDKLLEHISETLDAVFLEEKIRKHKEKDELLYIQSGELSYVIPTNSIISIETTLQHKIIITTTKERYEISSSLSHIEERLNNNFYRCHKSYIININHIKQVCTDKNNLSVIMENNKKCLVSRRALKEVIDYVKSDY